MRLKLAVIVIDMLKDFVGGKLGFERAKAIVPNIRRLLDFAHKRGVAVIYVCDAHSHEDPELKLWGEHAMAGSEGAQVVPELKPTKKDSVLEKRAYDIFFNTELDEMLRGIGVKRLLLTGVVTEICVQNSAAGAFLRGYEVTVAKDCVASPDESAHRASLEYMKRIYGARITTSKEFIKSGGG
ncbi:Peroxyureidoacrylate/ureidoacrylate amidohydrolase RutB [subsurface metagenome]